MFCASSSVFARLEEVYELMHAELGSCEDKMDQVDLELPVITVVESFGRFLKYFVKLKEKDVVSCSNNAASRDVFDVLMNSQRALQHSRMSRHLPEPVDERNKDKLHNDFLLFMASKNLELKHEIQPFGERLVRMLRDVLWYVDGHEDEFSRRSSAVPSVFEPFKGYNCPKKKKPRKHQLKNLVSDQLNTMATELAVLLQSNVWEREHWCNLKENVAGLAWALAGYAEYLTGKSKVMKIHHASTTPVREL